MVQPSLSLKLRVMKPGTCTPSAPAAQGAQLRHARQGAKHRTARLAGFTQLLQQHLAKRPPVTDPELAKLSPFNTWNTRWPITPLPGSAEVAAYFNLDNGSGKIRGIYTDGNPVVVPIFREWLGPFASMGATPPSWAWPNASFNPDSERNLPPASCRPSEAPTAQ